MKKIFISLINIEGNIIYLPFINKYIANAKQIKFIIFINIFSLFKKVSKNTININIMIITKIKFISLNLVLDLIFLLFSSLIFLFS